MEPPFAKFDIIIVHILPKTCAYLLRPAKDELGLRVFSTLLHPMFM
jgi:hypothetical protein